MRRILLGAVAASAILCGHARAQIPVTDAFVGSTTLQSLLQNIKSVANEIEMINNQLVQITHLVETVNAVAHGNIGALASLSSELGDLGLTNPLGPDTLAVVNALQGLGTQVGATGALAQRLLNSDTYYGPTAADWRAAAINQLRVALAQQKALAQSALDSSTQRLTALTNLRNQLDGKMGDVAGAAQATARLTGEVATTQAQTNQLLAAGMLQTATTATSQAREEQALRCSAEMLIQQARAATSAAQGGAVVLISGNASGASCAAVAPASAPAGTTGTAGTILASWAPDNGTVLGTMLGQSWGQTAADNATALGVNPTALAAACVLESGCSANVGGTGTISGAFQMSNGTYAQTVAEVQASNPALAAGIGGKNDPAGQSIAAAQYLRDGAQSLQARGITDPTVLDVRGFYNFGPSSAASIASASDGQLMAPLLSNLSSSTLAANGISQSTTVGQWRQGVTNKIGGAASQPVLLGRST